MKILSGLSYISIGMFGTWLSCAADINTEVSKIGIYDSRAVAVAYAGSDLFNQSLAPTLAEYKKAKDSGNAAKMAEIEKQMQNLQKLLHKQGFSTASVDDILKQIEPRLPQIKKDAGVDILVSKWDTTVQTNGKVVIDVTMRLVDEFHPSERQRKSATEIQKHKPISLEAADRIKD